MATIEAALLLVVDPQVLGSILLSATFGLFVGAIPGLTATMAVALLVPVTFFMPPIPAVAVVVTAVATAIFAGDIPGALLRIPGTPASAAYTEDTFALARAGHAERALGIGLTFSTAGGLLGTIVLASAAPLLAEFALRFSSFEYFWLACLGLSCAVFMAAGSVLKAITSLMLGLLVSTVGLDVVSGYPRFTFGSTELLGGVSFIPAMVGMFAISEILRFATTTTAAPRIAQQRIGNVFRGMSGLFRTHWRNFVRGNLVGMTIGVLPGAGGDIAAWIAYGISKRFSRSPERFGTGHVEGIIESTSANNAALASAWIPTLVFGIPGDSTTAIVIGVLFMKGLNPGPTVFLERPELICAVFLTFCLANLVMLPLGFLAIKSARLLLEVPRDILMPTILIICMVGAFAINNTPFGIIGYLMEENGFPIAPAVLGLVLGRMVEQNFMVSLIKADGRLLAFFERPGAAALGLATLAIWLVPPVLRVMRSSRPQRSPSRADY